MFLNEFQIQLKIQRHLATIEYAITAENSKFRRAYPK